MCVVRGRPSPQVYWTHNGQSVSHTSHVTEKQGAHRHTLVVKPVKEEDFGAYVCVAQNNLGQESAVIEMTGECVSLFCALGIFFLLENIVQPGCCRAIVFIGFQLAVSSNLRSIEHALWEGKFFERLIINSVIDFISYKNIR